MYGLPKDFDATVFVGRTLEIVCFNINQIYLHFDGDISVTVEGELVYQKGTDKAAVQKLSPPVKTANLMQALEHKIVRAVGLQNGTLSLTFDNGDIIKCVDTAEPYEAYHLKIGTKVIVV